MITPEEARLIAEAMSTDSPILSIRDLTIVLAAVTFMIIQILKMWNGRGSNGNRNGAVNATKADEAHSLITEKDDSHVYLFLRIPEYFHRLTNSQERVEKILADGFDKLGKQLSILTNHQNDIIVTISKRVGDLEKKN